MEIENASPYENAPRRVPQGKKLWQIEACYKCALIGTCLTRVELRNLAKKRIFSVDSEDDYRLHTNFIRISDRNDPKGQALHRYLVKKYQVHAKKYLVVSTDEAIKDLWEQDIKEGLFDGAWWSVLTHPTASDALVSKLYGFIHMLGHDSLNYHHRVRMHNERLASKLAILEEVLSSERQYYRQEKRQHHIEITELKQSIGRVQDLEVNNATLRAENLRFKQEIKNWHNGLGAENRQQEVDDLRQANDLLLGRVDELGAELGATQEAFTRIAQQLAQTETLRQQQERHEVEQAKEIATLETLLLGHIAEVPCSRCADHNTANCPGFSLCGKTVLYVGGLNNLIPHYRQLVEQWGGRFLHHDGGKEASRTLLPKMLTTADAVFCPIDCISHDACNCVKKMCKRYQKPFVLMRSSGISALAKGLSEIVQ